jgi:hypothetical protein
MLLRRLNDGSIEIDMKAYIQATLQEWGQKDYFDYAVPADEKLYYIDENSPASNKSKLFHRVVAKLLYLCKRGRPDVALPVHYLCTRVKNPTVDDEKKLVRVLGYLSATIDKKRVITKDGKMERITAYIDAAFAAHEDGYGQSGGAIFVGNTLVEVLTRKQKCSSRDSTEAELVALSDMVLDVGWHEEWFQEQGYHFKKPLIYQDNTSTITLVTTGGGKMRTKHMRALKASVLEGYEKGDYEFEHISTDDMVADLLTKPQNGTKHHKFSNALLGIANTRTANMITRMKTAGVRWNNHACEPGRICGCSKS